MRQRLGLAAALLRAPRLLILDEPTNGLDPQGIHEIRELLRELNTAGTTLFLSSHLLVEVEQLCTWVGIMDRGRLVKQDELANLRALTGRVVVRSPDADGWSRCSTGGSSMRDGDRLAVRHPDAAELNQLIVAVRAARVEIAPERRTLEDVVLAVTSSGSDRVDKR